MIGTGTDSKATLSDEATNFAEQASLQLHASPSYQAVSEFNHMVDAIAC